MRNPITLMLLGWCLIAAIFIYESAHAQSATYYADKFHGRKTASGERFSQYKLTCASNRYAFGTYLKVTNTKTKASVICRVNDTGRLGHGVVVDLSKAAFKQIAPLSYGKVPVQLEIVK
ncbi:septal ring lytic transglycosylase RlpA family protein [Moraxella sp. ZJ142]|uniref:septal ring lytic transglycosylase RlpA family protein n=1 Tax=Moraxella marmotae TaxID=3344520 RepID=UPI0035D411AA